jgi:ribosomal protein S12 methylthiotransferase accessory factor YcaO
MHTNAPTYAICVVLEDTRGIAPQFSLGLRADRSLPRAVLSALLEALRARVTSQDLTEKTDADPLTDEEIHLRFWRAQERSKRLSFLIHGDLIDLKPQPWERDSDEKHMERLRAWAQEKKYEIASVSLTGSQKNPTNLHIESVVIPELLPYYIREDCKHYASERLKKIPALFGYTPRETPYLDEPHPFG